MVFSEGSCILGRRGGATAAAACRGTQGLLAKAVVSLGTGRRDPGFPTVSGLGMGSERLTAT